MAARDPDFDPERPAVQRALESLEAAVGGRDALVETLVVAPSDPEFDYLFGLIADPREHDTPLGELCHRGNITPGALLRAYRAASLAKAQVLAVDKISAKLPEVAGDVVRRAVEHDLLCPTCQGHKTLLTNNVETDCTQCRGTGRIKVNGSLDHQRMALEMGGLLVKGGGTQVAVGVQVGTSGTPVGGMTPFTALQRAVQQVLAEPAPEPVVDAAFVEASDR